MRFIFLLSIFILCTFIRAFSFENVKLIKKDKVYFSKDNGITWNRDISTVPQFERIVYIKKSEQFISEDSGLNWECSTEKTSDNMPNFRIETIHGMDNLLNYFNKIQSLDYHNTFVHVADLSGNNKVISLSSLYLKLRKNNIYILSYEMGADKVKRTIKFIY